MKNELIDVDKFSKLRTELGQKKYGRGKDNAGWRRDNGRDVIEELHDAIVISQFWLKRVSRYKDDSLKASIESLIMDLWRMIDRVNRLRSNTPDKLKIEDVKRYPPAKDVILQEQEISGLDIV